MGLALRAPRREAILYTPLLCRRRHTYSRDELLDAFWPDIAPDVARNRLQIAISGLRRTLREVTNLHVIRRRCRPR
jgi:DNA-binding SARP family transcriptional activator